VKTGSIDFQLRTSISGFLHQTTKHLLDRSSHADTSTKFKDGSEDLKSYVGGTL